MEHSHYAFYNPVKIISGKKAVDQLTFELGQREAVRPILITDEQSEKSGIIKKVIYGLGGADIVIGAIFKFPAGRPAVDIADDIIRAYRENRCSSVIAVGGGAVFSAAYSAHSRVGKVDSEGNGRALSRPLIVVPVTPEAGVEVNISILDAGRDISMGAEPVFPDIAVLDRAAVMPAGRIEIAQAAMEAMAYSIEVMITEPENRVAGAFAHSAIRMIHGNIVKAVKSPGNSDINFIMMNGALHAGIALSNSRKGIIHPLSSALAKTCGISRGAAASVLIAHVMEYNFEKSREPLSRLLLPLAGAEKYAAVLPEKRAGRALQEIRDMLKFLNSKCSLPLSLSMAGIVEAELEKAAEMAGRERGFNVDPGYPGKGAFLKVLRSASSVTKGLRTQSTG